MTKLFVYGSLRKGCFNHHYIEDIAQFKGMFYVKGNIFTLTNQKYPALILSDPQEKNNPENFTIGELYEFSDDTENIKDLFEKMDKMEGYYGENLENNQYNKLYLDIYDSSYNKTDKAYVYVFNLNNPALKGTLGDKIKNNDFLNVYKQEREMTEKEKMLKGELYQSFGKELTEERLRAKELCFDFNNARPSDIKEKNRIIETLFGKIGKNFWIEFPFVCDYGYNIIAGDNLYINHNCTVLDCATVTFGNNVMIAPNVGIFTAGHPLDPKLRHKDLLEFAYPITVGNNVWIGANVIILPGVSIGDNSVIGAGSVVTKDIPENSVAIGNPCKVIKKIDK